ncbi:MAG: response regulator transcription factor [Eubacterium sp.]|nr:response regulator transcription factor [Eubacterium sp.]
MRRLLVVEDDREISGLLQQFLQENNFEVDVANEGNEASEYIQNEKYDIILMDMMLPYKSGDVLIKELRDSSDKDKKRTPVIVISAKTMKDTRLEVLRMGADDYIIKPFDLDEVLVRIEVVLRRAENTGDEAGGASSEVLSYAGIVLNKELNSVMYEEVSIKLTAKEMQLLELFLKNPKKTFTKANLYETVWQDEYIYDDNTINVHMSNLRSKLKKASGTEFIETVWGIGYKLKSIG